MLNYNGVTSTKAVSSTQILANAELQESVGCVVPAAIGVAVGTKKIAKAGTPVHVDLGNLQTPVTATTPNAVLLHDVDVTTAPQNGTALIFGFVNISRLESDVQAKATAGINTVGAVSFIKA